MSESTLIIRDAGSELVIEGDDGAELTLVGDSEVLELDMGTMGPQGPAGQSAYEVAVADGFVGDEAAWLASLVGPQGVQGVQGVQGIQGIQGIQGAKGDTGDQGPVGEAFIQLDGGTASSSYGGISPIDGGGA